nr:hypothetical protein [uncultured Chryseobacterium sp.]
MKEKVIAFEVIITTLILWDGFLQLLLIKNCIMNEFEIYLQAQVEDLKITRDLYDKPERDLFRLIFINILVDLSIIEKNFPSHDVNINLERCVYSEGRAFGYSPEQALEKTEEYMKERLNKLSTL